MSYNERVAQKKLYRSRDEKILMGLAGGMAKYSGVDVSIIRIGMVILEFVTAGLLIIIYFIVALFVPKEPVGGGKPSIKD